MVVFTSGASQPYRNQYVKHVCYTFFVGERITIKLFLPLQMCATLSYPIYPLFVLFHIDLFYNCEAVVLSMSIPLSFCFSIECFLMLLGQS